MNQSSDYLGVNNKRRKLMQAMLATPLAGGLATFSGAMHAQVTPGVIEGVNGWLYPGWENLQDAQLPACKATLDLVHIAAAKLAARDINCVMMIVPIKARLSEQYLPDNIRMSDDVRNRYDALLEHGKKIGLVINDSKSSLEALQTAAAPKNAYFRTDYHWSGYAAEANAIAVANQLRAMGPLAGKAGEASKLGKWKEEVRYGNLAELLPLERKKSIGKERFNVRAGSVSDGNLLDAEPPHIHIVGNSMVQPYLGFPQKLSQVLDRPVGLTWAFGNVGPWITFAKYLESDEFKQQRPRTLIWQFNEGLLSGPGTAGAWDVASLMSEQVWLERISKAIAG